MQLKIVGRHKRQWHPACIFCGGPANSKEHLLPNWLRRALPAEEGDFVDVVGNSETRGWSGQQGTGGVNSQKMRGVCRDCNRHWMSRLQDQAKPVLKRLAVEGEWWDFTDDERRMLMTWATMTTMVYDASHPPTSGIAQSERTAFYRAQTVLPGWHAWLGRTRNKASSRWLLHSAFHAPDSARIIGQITLLGLGQCVLQTFSGRLYGPIDALWAAQRMRLRVLWPRRDPLLGMPPSGWTGRRVGEALPLFTELVKSPGPKRLFFLYSARGVVLHQGPDVPGVLPPKSVEPPR